jgi:hypothetical protein
VNNWWGCNEGPTVCGPITGGVDADPWMVFRATAERSVVATEEPTTVRANFAYNSDGGVYGGLEVPNGIPVTFSTNLGTVSPASGATFNGGATTTFVSPTVGVATVQATIEGVTASTDISVLPPPPPPRVCSLIRLAVSLPGFAKPIIVLCI